jgi:hypothetical protein
MDFTPQTLLSGYHVNDEKKFQTKAKILIAGDLYPGGRSESLLIKNQAHQIWGDFVEEILDHNLRIVNLEAPLTNRNEPILKDGPHFRADPKCSFGIQSGGFNIVSLANNHINDMGLMGIVDTINACYEANLKVVGAGNDLMEAQRPLFVEFNDLIIAIINICEQEFSIATRGEPGAAPLDPIDNFTQIQKAKEKANFILVIFHGGVEFQPLPSPYMVKTCRFFIDIGANAVICHHIHVPSGVEVYKSAPIIYSTGNFVFDWGRETISQYMGYLVSIKIQEHQVNSLRFIPYISPKFEYSVQKISHEVELNFLEEIVAISKDILEPDKVQKEFESLIEAKKKHYIGIALSLSDFEKRMYNMGIWPFWRSTGMRLTLLKNTFSCSAHFNLMLNAISKEIKNLS